MLLVEGHPARATLLDFGIARAELSGAALTSGPMTGSGMILGTVGYMSPEQAMGDRMLDARADVFGLGCMLFECLTGEPVFAGDHVVAVLAKVLRAEAPRLRTLRPDLPEALDELLARMLSKDRASRTQDGGVVLRELLALGTIAGGAPQARAPASAGLSGGEQADGERLARPARGAPCMPFRTRGPRRSKWCRSCPSCATGHAVTAERPSA